MLVPLYSLRAHLSLIVIAAALTAGSTAMADSLPGKRLRLDGGTQLTLMPLRNAKTVSIAISWPGDRSRNSEHSQIAQDIAAELITAGCGERSAKQVRRALSRYQGRIDATAADLAFIVQAEFPSSSLSQGLDLLAECVDRPAFEHSRWIPARRRWEGRATREGQRLRAAALAQLFPDLELVAVGASIDGIERRHLARATARARAQSPLAIAIAGGFEPSAVEAWVRGWLRGRAPTHSSSLTAPLPTVAGQLFVPSLVTPHRILVGWGIPASAEVRAVLEVAARALELWSAFPARLRAEVVHVRERAALLIELICLPPRCGESLELLQRRLSLERPVLRQHHDRAQRELLASTASELTRIDARVRHIALADTVAGGDSHFRDPSARIAAVDEAAVSKVISKYLAWERAVIVTMGPLAFTPAAEKRARGVRRRVPRKRRRR